MNQWIAKRKGWKRREEIKGREESIIYLTIASISQKRCAYVCLNIFFRIASLVENIKYEQVYWPNGGRNSGIQSP